MASSTDWYGGMCFSARRQDLIDVAGCEESFSRWGYEDYDLARRMRKRGARIVRDDSIQVLHQVHPSQASGGWLMKLYAGMRQICAVQSANRGGEWGIFRNRPVDLLSGERMEGASDARRASCN
jgi:GT2 family glycosyltransferase